MISFLMGSYVAKSFTMTELAIHDIYSKLAALQEKVTSLTTTLETTQTALDTTQTALDETKSELDETKSELDETKSELDETKSELDETKSELSLATSRLSSVITVAPPAETFMQAVKMNDLDTIKAIIARVPTANMTAWFNACALFVDLETSKWIASWCTANIPGLNYTQAFNSAMTQNKPIPICEWLCSMLPKSFDPWQTLCSVEHLTTFQWYFDKLNFKAERRCPNLFSVRMWKKNTQILDYICENIAVTDAMVVSALSDLVGTYPYLDENVQWLLNKFPFPKLDDAKANGLVCRIAERWSHNIVPVLNLVKDQLTDATLFACLQNSYRPFGEKFVMWLVENDFDDLMTTPDYKTKMTTLCKQYPTNLVFLRDTHTVVQFTPEQLNDIYQNMLEYTIRYYSNSTTWSKPPVYNFFDTESVADVLEPPSIQFIDACSKNAKQIVNYLCDKFTFEPKWVNIAFDYAVKLSSPFAVIKTLYSKYSDVITVERINAFRRAFTGARCYFPATTMEEYYTTGLISNDEINACFAACDRTLESLEWLAKKGTITTSSAQSAAANAKSLDVLRFLHKSFAAIDWAPLAKQQLINALSGTNFELVNWIMKTIKPTKEVIDQVRLHYKNNPTALAVLDAFTQ
jgi:hypothetical protein